MDRFSQIFVTLAIMCLLAACVTVTASDAPEKGAQEFLQAVANSDGLKMDDRTCDGQKAALQQGSLFATALGAIGESVTGQKAKIDVSDVKFTTARSQSDLAEVKVSGRVRSAIGLFVQTDQLDTIWFMSLEGGKWKYCGGSFVGSDVTNVPAASPVIGEIKFYLDKTAAGVPTGAAVTSVPTNTKTVYAFFVYKYMPKTGVIWSYVWLYNGEDFPGATKTNQRWTKEGSGTSFVTLADDTGLKPGDYDLSLQLNGQEVQTGSIHVGP